MAQPECWRSMWATLTTAATTFGLFASANWGLATLVGDTRNAGIVKQVAMHAVYAFTLPPQALFLSLSNAFKVLIVKRALHNYYKDQRGQPFPVHSAISILTLCPIYIQIPEIEPNELGREPLAQCKPVTVGELKKLCPLQLRPTITDSEDPRLLLTAAANANDNSMDTDRWMYMQLPQGWRTFDYEDAGERYALLASGLAPENNELGYLPARNLFRSVVILVQAIGYVLGIIERLVEHLDISPVEAIITYLAILAAVQIVLEMYACGKFQRPLWLRLHHHQLHRFVSVPRKELQSHFTDLFGIVCGLASGVLVGLPSGYYFRHYMYVHNTISALPALLFYFALMGHFFHGMFSKHANSIGGLVCSLIFVCTIILAVVSTIVEWEVFKKPAHINWAHIFPHLSS